jgi:hypothetical protein
LAEEYKERGIAFNVGFGEQTEMLELSISRIPSATKANEMADYIFDFTLTGINILNGKVLCKCRLRIPI